MLTLDAALHAFDGKFSAAFLDAMRFTLSWETSFYAGRDGDYNAVRTENDPHDSGGATKYGVDQRSHPNVNVSTLTLVQALAIYRDGEWRAVRGAELPPDVALTVFDAAVNVGAGKAVRWLQAAVGAKQDGIMGPNTLAAVREHQGGLVDAIQAARTAYYQDIGRGSNRRYLTGWLNRVRALSGELMAA